MPRKQESYKEEYFFFYGTLMERSCLYAKVGQENVISIEPACIRGKMYANASGSFPFVVKCNQGRRTKSPTVVYGALVRLKVTPKVMQRLDSYEGCSKAILGENRPHDLYHRERVKVSLIGFNNIMDFTQYKLSVTGCKENAWIYYGNVDNEMVKCHVMNPHARAGVVWRSFFNLFAK